MSRDLRARARTLTWLLRHGAAEVGLPMDEAGFAPVSAVLAQTGLRADELDRVIAEDNKSRFERRGDQIRAAQGHSAGAPVSRAALEQSWAPYTGADLLWHGTTVAAARQIAAEGLRPMARSHVHLAVAPDSRVGKRAQVEVLLGLSPARLAACGVPVFLSGNGVALAREIPPGCVVAIRAAVKGVDRAALEAAFGLRS